MSRSLVVRVALAAAAWASIGLSPSSAAATVDPFRELMIVHPSVVDPFLNGGRSHNGAPNSVGGVWSVRNLLLRLTAGIPAAGRDTFYSSFFEQWLTTQTADNGRTIPPRDTDAVRHLLLDQFSYVDQATGKRVFQMWNVPFELTAIAFRPDLRASDGSDGGEVRFVYKLVGPDGEDTKFTLIMEYRVKTNTFDARTWAHNFHRLGELEIGSDAYLRLLDILTWYHTTSLIPTKPDLKHIRTNELAFAGTGGVWEMREFDQHRTSPTANEIISSAVENTPWRGFNNTTALANFVAANPVLGASGTAFMDFTMPQQLDMGAGVVPFLDSFADVGTSWTVPGETPPNLSVAVDNFGLLTCNGCHENNKAADDIHFYQVSPEIAPGQDGVARLSKFLTVGDPTKADRRPGELARRAANLEQFLSEPWSPTWIDY